MLAEIRRQLDELEWADGCLEARVQERLRGLLEGLSQSGDSAPLQIQKIRCNLMLGYEEQALEEIGELLTRPLAEADLQEVLRILRILEDPAAFAAGWQEPEGWLERVRFEQVMEQLPVLLQCQELSQLQQRGCELARRLLRCHEVHWLEGDLMIHSTNPSPGLPAQTLVQAAQAARKPLVGEPSTSESLLLSGALSALAIPLESGVCLYAAHHSLKELWNREDLEVASMLAGVLQLQLDLLLQQQSEEQHTRSLWETRNRLQQVVDCAEIGLVWLDSYGVVIH